MKYHFCTLFDKNYLIKGLALYNSLCEHIDSFCLWILCLDDETYSILNTMKLQNMKLIKLSDFETKELKEIRKTRSLAEYYFTLGPSFISSILTKPEISLITYLDADLFFFSSPKPIFQKFENHSVLITPHRMSPKQKDYEEKVGKYNVGLLVFRDDKDGQDCLNWWKNECLKWCYHRAESGRYADQKYLDYFPTKFNNVYILNQKGSNLAPWNIEQYKSKLHLKDKNVYIGNDKLIFFHFAKFSLYFPKSHIRPDTPSRYYLKTGIQKQYIYCPYAQALYKALSQIKIKNPSFSEGIISRPANYSDIMSSIKNFVKSKIKND
ncbi:MAG: glycosyl transferase [Candidatus Pacebacteria bacterium]|nr:glycosyl transferase [Candidatus Paceibacterota bacterium]